MMAEALSQLSAGRPAPAAVSDTQLPALHHGPVLTPTLHTALAVTTKTNRFLTHEAGCHNTTFHDRNSIKILKLIKSGMSCFFVCKMQIHSTLQVPLSTYLHDCSLFIEATALFRLLQLLNASKSDFVPELMIMFCCRIWCRSPCSYQKVKYSTWCLGSQVSRATCAPGHLFSLRYDLPIY